LKDVNKALRIVGKRDERLKIVAKGTNLRIIK